MLALSKATYPEIGALPFLSTMLSVQSVQGWGAIVSSPKSVSAGVAIGQVARSMLSKSRMETAYIRATRQDAGTGLKGTINRGELMEIMMRFTWAVHENNPLVKMISDNLQAIINTYLLPIDKRSRILPDRKIIRASVNLNQFLYNNILGLRMIYSEKKLWRVPGKGQYIGYFYYQSGVNLFEGLIPG